MALKLKAPSEEKCESVRTSLLRIVKKEYIADFAIRRVGEFNSLFMKGAVKEHEWKGGVSDLSLSLAASRKFLGKFIFCRQKKADRIFQVLKELMPAPELIEGQMKDVCGQKSG